MKRLILAISLIMATVVISFISLVAIERINDKMLLELDNILKYTNEENYTFTNDAVDHAIEQWEKEKPFLNVLIGQKETNEITTDLKMIQYFARKGDCESIYMYIYECKTELEKIKITNEPSLSTIL